MSGKYLYTGKLSFFESVNFLIPSLDPFLFKSLTPFRCVHVADTLARSFPIPLPVQGEGKRAWRARVRAASTQSLTCILVARSARRAHVCRASLSSPQRGSLRKQRHKRD